MMVTSDNIFVYFCNTSDAKFQCHSEFVPTKFA